MLGDCLRLCWLITWNKQRPIRQTQTETRLKLNIIFFSFAFWYLAEKPVKRVRVSSASLTLLLIWWIMFRLLREIESQLCSAWSWKSLVHPWRSPVGAKNISKQAAVSRDKTTGRKKTESPWKIKPVFRDFLPHWFTFKIPECLAVTTLSIRGGNWIEKLETKKNSAARLDVLRTSSRKVLGKRKVHPGVTLSTERAATAQAFVLEMKYAHCFFTTLERSF